MAAMDIQAYCDTHGRGTAASLARRMGVPPVLITQWARGERPVPRDRGPELEFHSDFEITAEEACPDAKWVRIPMDGWPKGKPLLDLGPEAPQGEQEPPLAQGARGSEAEQHASASEDRRHDADRRQLEVGPPAACWGLGEMAAERRQIERRRDGPAASREER